MLAIAPRLAMGLSCTPSAVRSARLREVAPMISVVVPLQSIQGRVAATEGLQCLLPAECIHAWLILLTLPWCHEPYECWATG